MDTNNKKSEEKDRKDKNRIEPDNQYSFLRGWLQVRLMDKEAVKKALWNVCGINNRVSWMDRLYGRVIPRADVLKKIEEVFEKRGIMEVWGDTIPSPTPPSSVSKTQKKTSCRIKGFSSFIYLIFK